MTRILAISSQVVRGRVGLSAICPALTHLGVDVMPLPTVVLSNHPGHPHVARAIIPSHDVDAMVDALLDNGWSGLDSILTGYLPTADHVQSAARAIDRFRRASHKPPFVLCDPVIGDDPKGRYIDAAAADAIRTQLIPRADLITPNRFELEYLAARPVGSTSDAEAAAQSLPVPCTIATSIPGGGTSAVNLAISNVQMHSATIETQPQAPRGTGDTFAAIFCALHTRPNATLATSLDTTTSLMNRLVAASVGRDELDLSSCGEMIRSAQ